MPKAVMGNVLRDAPDLDHILSRMTSQVKRDRQMPTRQRTCSCDAMRWRGNVNLDSIILNRSWISSTNCCDCAFSSARAQLSMLLLNVST